MAVSGYGAPQDHSGLSGNGVGDPHKQYSLVMVGLASARPVAGTGGLRPGTMYFATDSQVQSTYDGTTWQDPGLTVQEADRDYVRLVADNLLSGRNSFSPDPRNSFPVEYEPAGTNVVPNPSFEVDTSGWSIIGAGVTFVRSTSDSVFGTAMATITTTTGAGQEGVHSGNSQTAAPGEVWTASAWLRVPTGAARLVLRAVDAAGVQLAAFATSASGTAWQRLQASTAMPASTAFVRVEVDDNFSTTASTIHIDGVQLERGSTATSYIDGSLGTGYAWTGTAHASTSTRAANTVARTATDVATTNLIPDPSFVNGVGFGVPGWTASNGGTFSHERTGGRVGETCMRLNTGTSTAVGGGYFERAVTPGETYSGGVWLRTLDGSNRSFEVRISYRDAANSVIGSEYRSLVTITGEWQRYTSPTTAAAPAGTTKVWLLIQNNAGGNYDVLVDGAQLEAGSVATSYADGSLGTGFAWTGTAHASTSTRAAGTPIPPVAQTPPPYGLVADAPGRNIFTNPSFEIDLRDTLPYGGATNTRATSEAIVGGACLRIDVPTGANFGGVRWTPPNDLGLPVAPSVSHTFSAWMRATKSITYVMRIEWFTSAGAFISNTSINVTVGIGWQRFQYNVTSPSNAGFARAAVTGNNTDQGVYSVWLDGAVLEAAPVATSYMDGSLGPGYTWEGTPHASPSRRLAGAKVIGSGSATAISDLLLGSLGSAYVGAYESTTATTYADLATVGPTVSGVRVGESGRVLVLMRGWCVAGNSGVYALMSFAIAGPTSSAALDTTAVGVRSAVAGDENPGIGAPIIVGGLAPGVYTFTAKYRVTGGTASFQYRQLTVIPL